MTDYYLRACGQKVCLLHPIENLLLTEVSLGRTDPVIQRITPDFGQFLRQEPYTINLR